MNRDQDFLNAIRAAPDDDGLRLVYSDWLEEQGFTARADLIRVQCALAEMADDDPRRQGLERREQSLLGNALEGTVYSLRADAPWCAGWYPEDAPAVTRHFVGTFRRGLIEEVTWSNSWEGTVGVTPPLDVTQFLAAAAPVFAGQPVRRLAFDFINWTENMGGGGYESTGPILPAGHGVRP